MQISNTFNFRGNRLQAEAAIEIGANAGVEGISGKAFVARAVHLRSYARRAWGAAGLRLFQPNGLPAELGHEGGKASGDKKDD